MRPSSSTTQRATAFAAFVTVATGATALVGWLSDVPELRSVAPGLVAMNPVTAVCFVLSGIALWVLGRERVWPGVRNLAAACALAVGLAGALRLAGVISIHDLGLDLMLFSDRLAGDARLPFNRMAPNTALDLMLLGTALVVLRFERAAGRWWSQGIALVALLISFPAILGYAYGVVAFYRVSSYIPMALNTAIACFALSLGVLFATPDRGIARLLLHQHPGGPRLQLHLPLAALSVGAVGWLTLWGVRAGLYDMGVAACLGDTIVIVAIAVIALRNTVLLRDAEDARAEAAAALRRAHDELEQRVAERTADLERSNQELEREMAERRRAEEQIRAERQFTSQIVESSVDGIATADRELRITTWNPAMTRITGLPRERVLGRGVGEVLPFVIEGGEMVKMLRVLAGEAIMLRDRPFEVPETGRKGFFEGQFSPLKDDSGTITGGVAIVHEITERKNLERQFLQAQKMEAIGRLAGGVAHDFNNLLTAIMGYGQLMKRRLGADEQAHRDVEEILAAAARGAALTRQLLLFSRHQVVELQVLDLNQTIAGMDKMLRRLVGEDVDLVTAPAADPLHIRADTGQLEQVLLNLAVNARDAMPEGGKLTIETTTAELNARYAAGHLGVSPGRYAMLAVSDTGTGMSAETRAHIFEPFFTTKAAGDGTGLGLSTVHGIVTRSGGHIDVYTQLGQGTTFKVFLPLAEKTEARAADGAPSAQPRPGNEVVLLVEDEEPLRQLMRDSLELYGYTVLEAVDGSEAIGICERREQIIHLLVTDVVMPLMNGPELARRIALIRPDLRVLFVSGYADRALVHQGVRPHVSAFLQKPFMPETLAHRIRELLDQPSEDAA